MQGWIVIPNWRRFQHYRDRHPTWIKVYTELNSRADWLGLPVSARGVLATCWLEYARSRGQLRCDQVASLVGAGFKYAYLQRLSDAGFIQIVASKPLALRYQRASPEVEVEKKRKDAASNGARKRGAEASSYGELMTAARRYAASWNGGTSDAFDAGLDELEEITGRHLEAGDRYRLWDEALKGGPDALH